MATQKQSPLEEVRERLAEAAPTKYLPGLAALQNMRGIWADHRRRTQDGHRAMARAHGMEDVLGKDELEDMGDINVSGDKKITNYHHHPPMPASIADKLLPLALAAAIGAAGVWAWQNWPITPAAEPVDSEYEVRFYDRDGNPITVPHISQRKEGQP